MAGWRSTRDAEHATAAEVARAEVVSAATHFSTQGPAVLVTVADASGVVTAIGTDDLEEQAELRGRHLMQTSGRLFVFPGSTFLRGRMSVTRLLEFSAIDEVRLVGTPARVDPAAVVDTQGFVRPTLQDGAVVWCYDQRPVECSYPSSSPTRPRAARTTDRVRRDACPDGSPAPITR